jgi:hypothetical protein
MTSLSTVIDGTSPDRHPIPAGEHWARRDEALAWRRKAAQVIAWTRCMPGLHRPV